MSSYPSPTLIPLLICPARAALDSIQHLIQYGLPALDAGYSSPAWDPETAPDAQGIYHSPASPAPAGHWLGMDGMRLLRSDLPDTATGNFIILDAPEKSTRLSEDNPRLHLVPIRLRARWSSPLTPDDADFFLQLLTQILTTGLPELPGEETLYHLAPHYLSNPDFHVWEIRDVQTAPPMLMEENWHTVRDLTFTLTCCRCYRP